MKHNLFFNKKGEPIDAKQWSELLNKVCYRVLEQETTRPSSSKFSSYFISTIWVGVNLSFSEKPLIFETVVFDEKREEVEKKEYSTEEEAKQGHIKLRKKYYNKGFNN